MVKTVEMWSDKAQQVVSWAVELVMAKADDGAEYPSVLTLTHGDEVQSYSPNTTEDELARYVEVANRSMAVGHSNLEEAAKAERARDGSV